MRWSQAGNPDDGQEGAGGCFAGGGDCLNDLANGFRAVEGHEDVHVSLVDDFGEAVAVGKAEVVAFVLPAAGDGLEVLIEAQVRRAEGRSVGEFLVGVGT